MNRFKFFAILTFILSPMISTGMERENILPEQQTKHFLVSVSENKTKNPYSPLQAQLFNQQTDFPVDPLRDIFLMFNFTNQHTGQVFTKLLPMRLFENCHNGSRVEYQEGNFTLKLTCTTNSLLPKLTFKDQLTDAYNEAMRLLLPPVYHRDIYDNNGNRIQ